MFDEGYDESRLGPNGTEYMYAGVCQDTVSAVGEDMDIMVPDHYAKVHVEHALLHVAAELYGFDEP